MLDSTPETDGTAPSVTDHANRTAAKGRPTPKRSEAERRPRSPFDNGSTGGKTSAGRSAGPKLAGPERKAAAARNRAASRTRREADLAAMRRGDQSRMPARERGPVKQLARDYVDSRRVLLSEYVLFGLFALIIAIFVIGLASKHSGSGNVLNSSAVLLIELAILLVVALEGTFHSWRVSRLAGQRFPGESTRGLTWYVTKRSIRLRATRIPPVRNGIVRGSPV